MYIIFLVLAMSFLFAAFFVPIYFYLKFKKPALEGEQNLTFVQKVKNTVSIHKHFLKIEAINKKMTNLWIAMGKPNYPLPEDMVVIKQICAFLVLIIFLFIGLGFFSLILGVLAFFLPDISFKNSAKKRMLEIEKNLPATIDLLTLCVEAGMDFMAAVSKIIENSEENALRNEFQEVVRELQLGSSRKEALINFSKRCDIEEVTSFVSVIVQAEELGTSLVNVLRDYADEMRTKRWQKAEKLALEAPTKMLFPMIVFIFPGVFVLIFGPVGLQLVSMF